MLVMRSGQLETVDQLCFMLLEAMVKGLLKARNKVDYAFLLFGILHYFFTYINRKAPN